MTTTYDNPMYFTRDTADGRAYHISQSAGFKTIEAAIADTLNLRNYGNECYAAEDRALYADFRARGVSHLVNHSSSSSITARFYAYSGNETNPWHRAEFELPRGLANIRLAYALLQTIDRRMSKLPGAPWYSPDALETVLAKLKFTRAHIVPRGEYGSTELVLLRHGASELDAPASPQYALAPG